ncbi:hypothetical protein [Prosthecochloris sp. ZM_2]|uniref:hypothetical protein n=1 Tax=Prosthecochloris sp. ZM_2 TaxID=2045206 RepID=UPI0011CDB0EF|nr:hypothetical protein [Prosthecochloris sp. ZM_2]
MEEWFRQLRARGFKLTTRRKAMIELFCFMSGGHCLRRRFSSYLKTVFGCCGLPSASPAAGCPVAGIAAA